MTKDRRNEIISQINELITELAYDNSLFNLTADEPVSHPIEMLTIKECMQFVHGLSEHSIRKLVYQNKIKHIRAGEGKRGKILIYKDDLINYIRG